MRRARVQVAIVATLLCSAVALSSPASADPNGPGTTATVQVVDDKNDPIGADDRDNDPHVCHFHLYGSHFGNGSIGTWQIRSWAPTGNGGVVVSGTWKAGATGAWAVVGPSLSAGHYKLFAKQTLPATPGGDTQRVFWVECGTTTGPNGITIFRPGSSGGTGPAVRGFESAPSDNAVGAVTPIIELPGGSMQRSPNGAVNGVGTSPVAGVPRLPSTSTADPATAPLAALGVAIIALGGAMLRRKDTPV